MSDGFINCELILYPLKKKNIEEIKKEVQDVFLLNEEILMSDSCAVLYTKNKKEIFILFIGFFKFNEKKHYLKFWFHIMDKFGVNETHRFTYWSPRCEKEANPATLNFRKKIIVKSSENQRKKRRIRSIHGGLNLLFHLVKFDEKKLITVNIDSAQVFNAVIQIQKGMARSSLNKTKIKQETISFNEYSEEIKNKILLLESHQIILNNKLENLIYQLYQNGLIKTVVKTREYSTDLEESIVDISVDLKEDEKNI